jgi:hypothetical protein
MSTIKRSSSHPARTMHPMTARNTEIPCTAASIEDSLRRLNLQQPGEAGVFVLDGDDVNYSAAAAACE